MLSFCDKLGQLLSKVEEPCVVVVQDWAMFMVNMVSFAWTAAPAALVNSGLKYMQVRNIWTSTRAGKKSVGFYFYFFCSLLCFIFGVHIE
jgi:hypothetical protein